MVFVVSVLNTYMLVYYHKLESNLTDMKQRKAVTPWSRFLLLLICELPTGK